MDIMELLMSPVELRSDSLKKRGEYNIAILISLQISHLVYLSLCEIELESDEFF
jgi:hypothetical protein